MFFPFECWSDLKIRLPDFGLDDLAEDLRGCFPAELLAQGFICNVTSGDVQWNTLASVNPLQKRKDECQWQAGDVPEQQQKDFLVSKLPS